MVEAYLGATRILQKIVGALVIVGLAGIVLLVTLQIIDRYLFKDPVVWTEELARYVFVWSTIFGASLALRRFELICVTFILDRLPPIPRRIAMALGLLGVIVFFWIFVQYGSKLLVTAMGAGTTSPGLGAPMYLIYLIFPIGGTMMLIFSIACLIEVLMGRK